MQIGGGCEACTGTRSYEFDIYLCFHRRTVDSLNEQRAIRWLEETLPRSVPESRFGSFDTDFRHLDSRYSAELEHEPIF